MRNLAAPRLQDEIAPLTPEAAQERRVQALKERRELKMSRDAHAFVRGTTAQFYDWVSAGRHGIPEGPRIWICGDAHVGNLGPIGSVDSTVEVEPRDLDQTVPGNPAHDLVRLALSLAMAARSSDLPGVVTARIMEAMTAGYLEAFASGEGGHAAPADSASVRFVVREALRRKWRHLHRERIGKKPRFPFGARFLPLSDAERAEVVSFLDRERVRRLVTLPEARHDDAQIRLVDTAYWVKGCSSLGLWRCAALVEVLGHKGKSGASVLLDIKEAVAPVSLLQTDEAVPSHHGERVVRGAQAVAPSLGERMVAGTVAGHEVFVRELMPQDLKIELPLLDDVEARATAHALARIVGRSHARQLDAATRQEWGKTLQRAETRTLDAPSWLWASVVELIGIHERAYLEHCRRYALAHEKRREREKAADEAQLDD